MSGSPRLVLDFDGVICDALEETQLVTWLGVHPPAVDRRPVSSYLTQLPRGFRDRFRRVRDYSRVLPHFVVAHRPVADRILTRAGFDTVFRSLTPDYLRGFVTQATAARTRCRTEEPAVWLGMHTLYPGIADLLRGQAGRVAVVTAKDEPSVREILAHHGLGHTVVDVLGECSRKQDAVRGLAARYGIPPQRLTFVDDNLTNVADVAGTGAQVLWATWGYSTPEDRLRVRRDGIAALDLHEVHRLAS